MNKLLAVILLAILATSACGAAPRSPAPEFPRADWLNVAQPLTMQQLRGKVVLLDFWTYGCINCMHVIPDLKRLEKKYGNHLVVVSVHSPKFDNEKNLDTLRHAVVRLGIEHPVINDTNFHLMQTYGARAWPTLVLVDPAGGVVGGVAGEGNYEILDQFVGELVGQFRTSLSDQPLALQLEKQRAGRSFLSGPGKVAVSPRLVAISDTLNHRIVLADHQGKVQKIYGGPEAGFTDGQGARFNAPLGVSFGENVLYVADTGNHALRRIDLRTHEVSTLAGNGQQGLRDDRTGTPVPDARGVASPWDVLYSEGMLYIAMSGTQQIWRMDVTSGKLAPFAGNGREELVDGPLLKAAFSQPSGLSLFGHWLYVADAESSAVRRIDLRQGGKVETLVGAGLFDFGDRDGVFPAARLQHVLGVVALGDTEVLVADTYNHKLKRLDLGGRSVTTLAGDGKPGKSRDGVLQMNEPGGLARYGNLVYIADTNNDRILRYDLERGSLEDWVVKP